MEPMHFKYSNRRKVLKINKERVHHRDIVHDPNFIPDRTDMMLDCLTAKGLVSSS